MKSFKIFLSKVLCGDEKELGREKIINHYFEHGQGNQPSCQRYSAILVVETFDTQVDFSALVHSDGRLY